jgi:hypothetical protein
MNDFLPKFVSGSATCNLFKGFVPSQQRLARLFAGWLLGLLLLTGCSQLATWGLWTQATQFILINDVQLTQTPGRYRVSGEANLADGVLIAVSAVRPLKIGKDIHSEGMEPATRYSILDRQLVPVVSGTWQTELTLAAAKSGNYETWQTTYQGIQGSVTPALGVNFMATLDPGLQPDGLAQRLLQDTTGFAQGHIRLNDDGELFAVAMRTLEIAPPADGEIVASTTRPAPVSREQPQPADGVPSLSSNREPASTLPLAPEAYLH